MSQPPAPWLDRGPLSREWPEPAPRRTPRWVRIGVPCVLVALLAGLVLAGGGLTRRTDTTTVMAPGAPLDTHQLVYTFDRAVAEQETAFGETQWLLTLEGTVANLTGESLRLPTQLSDEIAVRGVPGDHLAEIRLADVGGPTSAVLARGGVPPGTTFPLTLTATLPADYRPSDRLLVGVCELELSNQLVLDPGAEPQWNPTGRCFAVFLPLAVRATA